MGWNNEECLIAYPFNHSSRNELHFPRTDR